ncbi:short transient receptor potential channel 5-like [Branchiostoma floridae x Branchiostoma japonicum]
MEAHFLSLVRNNDVSEVSTVLGELNVSPDVSPDLGALRDKFGRSVLELAVDSGSREVAEVLLDHGAPIGDSLLYAIDRQDVGVVRTLKERALTETLGRTYGVDSEDGSIAFPSYMTPVMLAAMKNNYDILDMLLQAGFPTLAPDDYKWTTDISETIAWLDAYRAVCSPSYILLTSPDPFRTAFRTAKALRDVLWKREQYRPELEQLADQCETFACELLDEARSTKEARTILEHLCSPEDSPYRKSASTIQLAFVTHPFCFEYVNQRKFQEIADFHPFFQGFETASSVYTTVFLVAVGLAYPFLCLAHVLAPQSKIGKFSSLSVIREMYWTVSWIVLLILLLVQTQSLQVGPAEIDRILQGTPAFWGAISLDAHSEQNTVADDWAYKANESSYQPVAVADALSSIITIIVFIRAMSPFANNRFLGMLLISIGRMAVSIMKFVVLDGLVLFAFALGLNQLYWFYGTMHQYLCSN